MCLSAEKDGKYDVIANDAGDRVTPAIYGILNNESLVGLSAKQLSARKPNSVAFDSKGRILSNDADQHFQLDDDGKETKVSVEKVHTYFYKSMKEIAISYASADEVAHCNTVITVPMEFTKKQREFVKKCALTAGFHVHQIISETAASILAYAKIDQVEDLPQKIVVFRCGGKSLTCSLVLKSNGMVSVLHSINKDIGGDIVTDLLVEMLAQDFIRKFKLDPRETKRSKMKLKINAENVKHVLSTLDNANCYIESLCEGIDFNGNISRSRFDSELSKLIPKFTSPIEELLSLAQLEANEIDAVIFCGGTAKIPKLQSNIKSMFAKAECLNSINPDEVIAVGASIQASLLPDDCEDKADFNGQADIQATNYEIVYSIVNKDESEPTILIARQCPIPVRKSHHLTCEGTISVKMFLRSAQGEMTEMTEVNKIL